MWLGVFSQKREGVGVMVQLVGQWGSGAAWAGELFPLIGMYDWGGGGRDVLEGWGGTRCVTFHLVDVPLWGPGQSPVLPFACCVGLLRSVGRCGQCSCWCRFRVCGAQ